jgi:hypothetical protein
VLALGGSTDEEQRDHLIVRTPPNPGFQWGNCVLVTDAAAVGDAARWVTTFRRAFPEATWLAIGLVRRPDDASAWAEHGLAVDVDLVLTRHGPPPLPPLPAGYEARQLAGTDWDSLLQRSLATHAGAAAEGAAAYESFARARLTARKAMSQREEAAFFGAFAGARLVADLGIVRCGR